MKPKSIAINNSDNVLEHKAGGKGIKGDKGAWMIMGELQCTLI